MNHDDDNFVVRILDEVGAVVLTRRTEGISTGMALAINGSSQHEYESDHPPPWIQTIVGKGTVEFRAGE